MCLRLYLRLCVNVSASAFVFVLVPVLRSAPVSDSVFVSLPACPHVSACLRVAVLAQAYMSITRLNSMGKYCEIQLLDNLGLLEKHSPEQFIKLKLCLASALESFGGAPGEGLKLTGVTPSTRHCGHVVAGTQKDKWMHESIGSGSARVLYFTKKEASGEPSHRAATGCALAVSAPAPGPPRTCLNSHCQCREISAVVFNQKKQCFSCQCRSSLRQHRMDFFQGRWMLEDQRQAFLRKPESATAGVPAPEAPPAASVPSRRQPADLKRSADRSQPCPETKAERKEASPPSATAGGPAPEAPQAASAPSGRQPAGLKRSADRSLPSPESKVQRKEASSPFERHAPTPSDQGSGRVSLLNEVVRLKVAENTLLRDVAAKTDEAKVREDELAELKRSNSANKDKLREAQALVKGLKAKKSELQEKIVLSKTVEDSQRVALSEERKARLQETQKVQRVEKGAARAVQGEEAAVSELEEAKAALEHALKQETFQSVLAQKNFKACETLSERCNELASERSTLEAKIVQAHAEHMRVNDMLAKEKLARDAAEAQLRDASARQMTPSSFDKDFAEVFGASDEKGLGELCQSLAIVQGGPPEEAPGISQDDGASGSIGASSVAAVALGDCGAPGSGGAWPAGPPAPSTPPALSKTPRMLSKTPLAESPPAPSSPRMLSKRGQRNLNRDKLFLEYSHVAVVGKTLGDNGHATDYKIRCGWCGNWQQCPSGNPQNFAKHVERHN